MQLETHFPDRDAYIPYLRAQFPTAEARSPEVSPIRGGRAAAETRLQHIEVERYSSSRNLLNGAVTHLSPYLRHGVLTLAEVRHDLLQRSKGQQAHKLLQELAWRDYYQRVYARLGQDIWSDIEPYKTGVTRYAENLPADVEQGTTGLACMDAFAYDLHTTGYLHNHARMWTAAYLIHHRRVRWQAGARWFLQHLLDGDPASNNLSWQWVASTFAAKPYYFNRDNLAHYSENRYCAVCPLLARGCPFEGSYEELARRIFPRPLEQMEQAGPTQTTFTQRLRNQNHQATGLPGGDNISRTPDLVWIHEENLSPYNPALQAHPQARPLFIFDENAIEEGQWSLKRIVFIYECLREIPGIQIYRGSPLEILATSSGQSGDPIIIATTPAIEPRLRSLMAQPQFTMQFYDNEPFIPNHGVTDLRRFSRYWHEVAGMVLDPR